MAKPTSTPHAFSMYFLLVRGTVALALGVALLLSGSGLSRLASFVAVYWIAAALVTLRWAASLRVCQGRRLGLIAGLIGLATGVALALRRPLHELMSEGLLLDLLGLSAIATGVLRLSGRFRDDQLSAAAPRLRYRIVLGVLDVVLGVALVVAAKSSSDQIRIALGAWGLLTGTLLLLDALELRRRGRSVGATSRPTGRRPGARRRYLSRR